eukprot:3108679-Rhodomonas_salina.1
MVLRVSGTAFGYGPTRLYGNEFGYVLRVSGTAFGCGAARIKDVPSPDSASSAPTEVLSP